MKKIIAFLFVLCPFMAFSQQNWVDSLMNTLTLDQKIGQLIVSRSFAKDDSAYFEKVAKEIDSFHVGGVCFFKGTPAGLVKANNLYQNRAKVPLMISIDGEWGVAMRMDSVIAFPKQQTLGAIDDNGLIYQMGGLVADQCKRLGIHIDFVPCADINNNPKNPVINTRSFGESQYDVADKSVAYMKGFQHKGILTSAKHFPGHGDTETDSHEALPTIHHSRNYIDSIDVYPFKALFTQGVSSVMVGHLNVPALDTVKRPASLSPIIVDSFLQKELGFSGLIFTDGLEMKGLTSAGKPGETEVLALLAGNDILLVPLSVPAAFSAIKQAIADSILTEERINKSCRKILQAKYDAGIHQMQPVSTEHLMDDLNTPQMFELNKQIYSSALTLIRNKHNILPLKISDYERIACVSVGDTAKNIFQQTVDLYANVTHFNLSKNISSLQKDSLLQILKDFDLIICAVANTNISAAKNYNISPSNIDFIGDLQNLSSKFVLTIFASPYSAALFEKNSKMDAWLIAYQEASEAQEAAAQLLFGAIPAKGHLPVTVSDEFPYKTGISTQQTVLNIPFSQQTTFDASQFKKIDSMALNGIAQKAYPGCQILIAKNGRVIYDKSFGSHTYEDSLAFVKRNDVYDVASLTKVAATTLAMMKLYEKGKYDLDDKMSRHLSYLKKTNKKDITFRQVLAHQARLKPSIFMDGKMYLCAEHDSLYCMPVAENAFTQEHIWPLLRDEIVRTPLLPEEGYKYSDIGFQLLADFVKEETGKSLDEYVDEQFYKPMGLRNTTFRPLDKVDKNRIIPTENDTLFRHQLVHGYVHDPTVALMGGVGGSAGLFSTAENLAVLLQMLLQGGEYGGVRYLKSETINTFTKQQFPGNRRGAGFDKPLAAWITNGPCCKSASPASFGHSGFTGTYFWADPDQQLLYVFLSNRVYPDAHNTKLSDMNIRTDIHQAVYDILMKK